MDTIQTRQQLYMKHQASKHKNWQNN